ncbi:MAG: lycopene cyclase family protein, partial [Myxococcota bacterium]
GRLPVRHHWRRTEAVIDGEVFDLGRGYALVDNEAAHALLTEDLDLIQATVEDLDHQPDETQVTTTAGTLRARIIVDATGVGRFTKRKGTSKLYQTALGQRLHDGAHPFPTDAMRFMDFRSDERSFLYAMPMSSSEVFMEQTRLIDPEQTTDSLTPMLEQRIAEYGVTGQVSETEHVSFPMDVPLPDLDQRVVAFGAAAGFVHPATGYSLGHSVRLAPVVADAIHQHIEADAPAAVIARAAYGAMWPKSRLRSRFLYLYGAQIVARFDAEMQAQFFRTFFHLPTPVWAAYLSGDAHVGAVANAMWSVFRKASWGLKLRLSTGSLPALG